MEQDIKFYLNSALKEDIGNGDHTSLACIPLKDKGQVKLVAKENGIIAGIEISKILFQMLDNEPQVKYFKKDGDVIYKGEKVFKLKGDLHTILSIERLLLNIMQRMSGIASLTKQYVDQVNDLDVKILDTRKTTPNFRVFQKMAVKIGGAENHRQGLFDMIMIKDNHIDFSGGVKQAIENTKKYLTDNSLDLDIIVEVRNIEEVKEVLDSKENLKRILLDNFSPEEMTSALELINNQFETEASGGINLYSIRKYAETGVNYISIGALTHSPKSLDLSLLAIN